MSPKSGNSGQIQLYFYPSGHIKIYVVFSAACELTTKQFEHILEKNFQDWLLKLFNHILIFTIIVCLIF